MDNQRKPWVGLTTNQCVIQGNLVGNPQYTDDGTGGEIAWLHLSTIVRAPDATGAWVDHEHIVPVGVEDTNKIAAIKQYVQEGRKLQVFGHFKTWDFGNQRFSGILGKQVEFGEKPYTPKEGPNLPSI